MSEKKIFKVEASYFLKADSASEAEQMVADEAEDFIERHVLVSPANKYEIEMIEHGVEDIYEPK